MTSLSSDRLPGLVDAYRAQPAPGADEMLGPDGAIRPAWQDLAGALDRLGADGLRQRQHDATRLLDGDGVVYRVQDSDDAQRWGLDPLPIVLEDAEWAGLEPGLAQRARLLDLILTDLYGRRSLLRRGLLPAEVVFGHDGFLRDCDQIRIPGPHQLFTLAVDLARAPDGQWVVLHDRAQSPSGAGFAMENRRVVSRVLPDLYRDAHIHRLGPFFHAMRLGLQEVAPLTAEAPRAVLLTSGPHSETAYDQAFLSSLLGCPLAEGADLSVHDGRLWLRGIDGPEQVDVVLRRVDSGFCDPLELRADSQLGVPGLLEAARLGTVSVVNGLGSGVLENPGLLPFLPALCRDLLDEELALPSAPTWWCGDAQARAHVTAHLDQLVLKPLSRGIGRSSIFGWELSAHQRSDLLAQIAREPHRWVGQDPVALSTVPTSATDRLEPRHMLLRSFAVAQGGGYRVLAGGLVRVAPSRDSITVSSQTGALAKDAWVLTSQQRQMELPWLPDGTPAAMRHAALAPRVAEDLFWLGRYAERAESALRLLRTVRDRSDDFTRSGDPDGELCLNALLEVLTTVTTTWPGFAGPAGAVARTAPHDELFALVADPTRPGTLAHSTRRLTETAAAVRDQLSPDTWALLGTIDGALRSLDSTSAARDVAVAQALTRSLGALLALAGLASESMVRDLGWHLMELGRRIERAQQIVALLRAALVAERPDAADGLVVESVLIAAESLITHRRRYAPSTDVASVLELLLSDHDNPRSLAHQLLRMSEHLNRLPDEGGLREVVTGLATTLRTADVTALSARVVGGRRRDLAGFLGALESDLRDLGRAVELTHLAQPLAPQPLAAAP